jgi:hypothetical protein
LEETPVGFYEVFINHIYKKSAYMVFTENLKVEDHLENLGVDGSITLKLLLKVKCMSVGLGSSV